MRLPPLLAAAAALRVQLMRHGGPIRCLAGATGAADAAIVEPKAEHRCSVIFLHGLGDTGDGWASLMPELDQLLPPSCAGHVRWLLPHAPKRPITLNRGAVMNGWFDIAQLTPDGAEDAAGLEVSAARIAAYIEREVASGIPRSRIAVGGFSQGGALALHVGLRSRERLAGCLALGSWLPLRTSYPAALGGDAGSTPHPLPLLLAHGDSDAVVPISWARQSHAALLGCGLDARFVSARGVGHGVDAAVLREVGAFLGRVLDSP